MTLPKVFLDSNSAFIHIPKTAGIAISVGLYGLSLGHIRASSYFRNNEKKWEDLFSFTFVRDPISRFVSAYNFLKTGGINKYDLSFSKKYNLQKVNINEFVIRYFSTQNMILNKTYIHFIPQVNFLLNPKDNFPLVSKVYRFENIEESYKEVVNELRSKTNRFTPYSETLPKLNLTSNHTSNTRKTDLSNNSIKVLKNYYSEDIQTFGYL
tara:strand:- start:1299 stop:1928 length:630 start_codon:yes stop_codon:yes gene_type:complete